MDISYTLTDSPLGRLLVAATEHGISAVCLGDDDAALERALCDQYPEAQVRRDDDGARRWLGPILAYLEGGGAQPDLPLDAAGTSFEWSVWRELRRIPTGQTCSYGEIARRIGHPGAARAVGRACARNPAALVIPCHRAVGSDGDPVGYRWGIERKIELLAHEFRGALASAQR